MQNCYDRGGLCEEDRCRCNDEDMSEFESFEKRSDLLFDEAVKLQNNNGNPYFPDWGGFKKSVRNERREVLRVILRQIMAIDTIPNEAELKDLKDFAGGDKFFEYGQAVMQGKIKEMIDVEVGDCPMTGRKGQCVAGACYHIKK